MLATLTVAYCWWVGGLYCHDVTGSVGILFAIIATVICFNTSAPLHKRNVMISVPPLPVVLGGHRMLGSSR